MERALGVLSYTLFVAFAVVLIIALNGGLLGVLFILACASAVAAAIFDDVRVSEGS